jgi:hypothetical protein
MMKKLSLLVLVAFFGLAVNAQEVKFANVDKSPLDVVYYPLKATQVKAGDTSSPVMKVTYSRPSKNGREIFGALIPFGKVDRLGANESTEIKFFKPVTIGKKTIKPGSYSLFAIPNKDNWTIIVNEQTDRWGAYTYNQSKDVVRVDVPVKPLPNVVEVLSMTFVPQSSGANLVIGWDKTAVELPIQFK